MQKNDAKKLMQKKLMQKIDAKIQISKGLNP